MAAENTAQVDNLVSLLDGYATKVVITSMLMY